MTDRVKERVARAIHDYDMRMGLVAIQGWDHLSEHAQDKYLSVADAVLEALRSGGEERLVCWLTCGCGQRYRIEVRGDEVVASADPTDKDEGKREGSHPPITYQRFDGGGDPGRSALDDPGEGEERTERGHYCNVGAGCPDSRWVGGNYGSYVCRNPDHHARPSTETDAPGEGDLDMDQIERARERIRDGQGVPLEEAIERIRRPDRAEGSGEGEGFRCSCGFEWWEGDGHEACQGCGDIFPWSFRSRPEPTVEGEDDYETLEHARALLWRYGNGQYVKRTEAAVVEKKLDALISRIHEPTREEGG